MQRAAQLVSVALAIAACGEAGAGNGWTVTVDTLPGGRVTVINAPPPDESGPTWILEEELRIGSIDETGPASKLDTHTSARHILRSEIDAQISKAE